jgi:hypothetical protein
MQIYIKKWFLVSVPAQAPKNDLNLLKELLNYREINANIANEVLKTFQNHLWYLNECLVALAFFDRNVSINEKREMLEALEKVGHIEMPKRIQVDLNNIHNMNLAHFVSENTKVFFETMFDPNIVAVNLEFLKEDPSQWYNNDMYIQAEEIVSKLMVVNDTAERAVALLKEFNAIGPKQEEQKQALFIIMHEYRQIWSSKKPTKKEVIEKMQKRA